MRGKRRNKREKEREREGGRKLGGVRKRRKNRGKTSVERKSGQRETRE